MLKKIICIGLISMLAACAGSNVSKSTSSNDLKDQRLSTDFTDEGIKISYTFTGKLESIEVYGQAEAWRGNVEAVAEADAMAKLTKFIYGKDVSTNRRVQVIGRSIEAANDNKLSMYTNKSGDIDVTDKQIDAMPLAGDSNGKGDISSTAERQAKVLNETIVSTITNITSKGRLVGVRKIRDFQRNDGKVYVAVYVWSEKNQATSEYIKNRMQNKQ
jgi:hypothetical protein